MTDIVNNATIMVTADASGVEAGLRPAVDAAQNAERAISSIGGGSQASARAQQTLIRAIERTTIQMQAGSRAGSLYFEILGRRRGIDPNVLRPYLEELRRLEQAQQRAGTSAEDAGSAIKGALGSALAGLSIAGFMQQVISAQREFDKLNASLKTAVGSTEAAAEAFDALEGFASTTPYSVQQATEAFVKLRNMGLDPSERALRSYGNTASAMGKDLDQMIEAVADAATGEFERLKEFGIKASQENGKVSLTFKGTTTTIVNNAAEIEKYLMRLGEVDFASAMAERANTLDGAFSNFGDSWTSTMRTIAQGGIGDAAQQGLLGVSGALEDLQHMLDAVTEAADKQGKAVSAASIIHQGLTTVFEAVTVLGVNVLYVFTQIGNEIGGRAAQVTALAKGEFAQARAIGEMMRADAERDRREVDAKSAGILGAAKKARDAAAAAGPKGQSTDVLAQYRIQREAERESAQAAKARDDQLRRESAALAELAGLTSSFADDWKMLSGLYGKGSLSLEQLVKAQADLLAKQPAMKAAAEQEIADRKAAADAAEQYAKAFDIVATAKDRAVSDLQNQRDENEQIGLGAVALAELNAVRLESMALRAEEKIWAAEGIDITGQLAEQYRQEAAALRERATAVREGAAKQVTFDTNKKALDELNQFLDPSRAQTFGEALRESFGTAGDSISKLTASLDEFGRKQAEIDKHRATAEAQRGTKDFDEVKYQKTIAELNDRETKNRLAGYGAMTNAAAGFFGEQSRGYKALQTASQVFHAAELAMTLAELVPKGVSAVLTQGQGDAYSAFARMAAMAAIVTGLGVAIGGIGGKADTTAVDRQKANGTGSILGDSDAKSESIKNALGAIEDNTYQGLTINSSMLTVLRSIDSGINGVSNMLYRTSGFTTQVAGMQEGAVSRSFQSGILGEINKALSGGEWFGKALGKVGNAIFGGNVTTVDTGITFDAASLAQILASGINVGQYTDTKKDGGLFRKDKYGTTVKDLGDEIDSQFTLIFGSMYDAIVQGAGILGVGGGTFIDTLSSFKVDLGKISTKDMKPEDVQAALQNAISKAGDDMAKFAVAGLGQFRKAGEGALETLTRIAAEYQTVDVVMESFGKTFGIVGMESVGARERLIDLAGGLEEFASSAEQFLNDFYSDQERADSLRARITPTLDQYGIKTGAEDSLQQFRSVVTGLDLTTEAGARAYATLIQIAPAFKQIADVDADRAEKAAEVAAKLLDLQAEIFELTGDRAGAAAVLAQQQAAALVDLDPALRGATQRLWELQAAASAVDQVKANASTLLAGVDGAFSALQGIVTREKGVLQKRIDVETEAVNRLKSLSDSISSTLDSMKVPGAEALSRQMAQSQISAALAAVRGGAELSDAQIKSLGKAFSAVTQDSTRLFGSREDYVFDLLSTRNDIAQLGELTDSQLSAEEAALKQLKDQSKALDDMLAAQQEEINVLKGLSTVGLSIEQAIKALQGFMASANANPVVSAGSAINNAYQQHLGRAPDAAGFEWWKNAAAGGTPIETIVGGIAGSTEANLKKLYKDVLGREPDAEGLAFWMNAYGPTMSEAEKADWLKAAQKDAGKKLPGFDIGTNRVPYDMDARIHKDERIIPAADNRELMRRLASPADNSSALAETVRTLTATVATLKEANAEMAKDLKIMAQVLGGSSPNGQTIRVKVVS